jgi:hypothetical protein
VAGAAYAQAAGSWALKQIIAVYRGGAQSGAFIGPPMASGPGMKLRKKFQLC